MNPIEVYEKKLQRLSQLHIAQDATVEGHVVSSHSCALAKLLRPLSISGSSPLRKYTKKPREEPEIVERSRRITLEGPSTSTSRTTWPKPNFSFLVQKPRVLSILVLGPLGKQLCQVCPTGRGLPGTSAECWVPSVSLQSGDLRWILGCSISGHPTQPATHIQGYVDVFLFLAFGIFHRLRNMPLG